MNTMRTYRRAQSGQVIVLMALFMVGLIGFTALAVDVGRFYSQRRMSQNASDMAALAGIYQFANLIYAAADANGGVPPTNIDSAAVLRQINKIAEQNGIPDTDGTNANEINGNVQAWWVNSTGQILGVIENNPVQPIYTGTAAIKVRTQVLFQTFFAGLIGLRELTAEAPSTATINVRYEHYDDNTTSIFTAGAECDNLTNRIAHHYADTNSAKFLSGVYVDGSLAVGSVNASDFYGNVEARVIAGTGPIDGPYTMTTGNPLAGGGNKFNNGAVYIPPSGKSSPGIPQWARIAVRQPDGTSVIEKLDARHFRPATPIGEMYRRYLLLRMFGLAPQEFYFYIPGDITPGTAANAINTLYNQGKRGIFYVEGDLTIPAGTQDWEGVTLIINGRFNNLDANHDFWSAGNGPSGRNLKISGLAMNISILAGGDLAGGTPGSVAAYGVGTERRCGTDPNNWIFRAENNNTQYHGITYVPWGQIYFSGNTSGGSNFSEGVITYSVYLNGNSWQFLFNPDVWVQPFPSTELIN